MNCTFKKIVDKMVLYLNPTKPAQVADVIGSMVGSLVLYNLKFVKMVGS